VDFNCAMTAGHRLVELQGSAEHGLFSHEELGGMLEAARLGVDRLVAVMQQVFPEGARVIAGS
jgi:ribonuclease PH